MRGHSKHSQIRAAATLLLYYKVVYASNAVIYGLYEV
jgi:hypothetical protein